MTQEELSKSLETIGLPINYHHFKKPPNPPYIVYLFSYSNDIIADNINYVPISNFQVELYTNRKDLASEKLVEDKFRELEIPYTKLENWIEIENLYQVVYGIKLI